MENAGLTASSKWRRLGREGMGVPKMKLTRENTGSKDDSKMCTQTQFFHGLMQKLQQLSAKEDQFTIKLKRKVVFRRIGYCVMLFPPFRQSIVDHFR